MSKKNVWEEGHSLTVYGPDGTKVQVGYERYSQKKTYSTRLVVKFQLQDVLKGLLKSKPDTFMQKGYLPAFSFDSNAIVMKLGDVSNLKGWLVNRAQKIVPHFDAQHCYLALLKEEDAMLDTDACLALVCPYTYYQGQFNETEKYLHQMWCTDSNTRQPSDQIYAQGLNLIADQSEFLETLEREIDAKKNKQD